MYNHLYFFSNNLTIFTKQNIYFLLVDTMSFAIIPSLNISLELGAVFENRLGKVLAFFSYFIL